ncbi:MAG: WYL domain-containing protein [Desulfobulbaceae bacterium]|nr:WYL domain-containing protein [Desulfobulbaceae bacterium]
MYGNKTQLQRLLFIDRMIREGMKSGRLANCTTIAAAYEVSPKSIMRDIDYLKNQRGAPLEYDQRRYGFYYTEASYQLPAMQISESDLFAISLARKTLRQYENTPLYHNLVSVFKKIEESLPERISVDPAWLDERLTVIPESRTIIDPAVWESVAEGLRLSRQLEVHYLKPGEETTRPRLINPYHVVNFQGEWYLIGYCHSRREIRTFAFSRIRASQANGKEFTIPIDFSFEQFSGHQFGIFKGDRNYLVRLVFSQQHSPYIKEREWHRTQHLEPQADGRLLLSFTTNHLFEVKRWVLSWGSGVKALEPPELVDNLREELLETLKTYK